MTVQRNARERAAQKAYDQANPYPINDRRHDQWDREHLENEIVREITLAIQAGIAPLTIGIGKTFPRECMGQLVRRMDQRRYPWTEAGARACFLSFPEWVQVVWDYMREQDDPSILTQDEVAEWAISTQGASLSSAEFARVTGVGSIAARYDGRRS